MCDIEQLLIWNASSAATAKVSPTPETRTMEALNRSVEMIPKLIRLLDYHSLLIDEHIYLLIHGWAREVLAAAGAATKEVEPLRRQASQIRISLDEREVRIEEVLKRHLQPCFVKLGEIRKDIKNTFKQTLTANAG